MNNFDHPLRSRESMLDLNQRVFTVFNEHPLSVLNDDHEPTLPADALKGLFNKFTSDGSPLLNAHELGLFDSLVAAHPGLQVTPNLLLGFVAERTKQHGSQPVTPDRNATPQLPEDEQQAPEEHEGQLSDPDNDFQLSDSDYNHRRSPSSEGQYSRPPSRGPPATPNSGKSLFDIERRQRSTPLTAPSSWTAKRPQPAARRKSDAGNRSDSEYGGPFQRSSSRQSRSRAPSNPTSPTSAGHLDLNNFPSTFSPVSSPAPYSRPPSRQGPTNTFGSFHFGGGGREDGYDSPDENTTVHHNRRRNFRSEESFRHSVNSIPLPRNGEDSDSDDELSVLGLVTERDIRPSDASVAEYERLEALQKQNKELHRKRLEAEELLHRKVAEHEAEYAELEVSLEQLRTELSAAKREEKELRSKERQNMSQIAALEQEVVKITKQLEHARSTYTSLQKQYQEQCAHSEKYRNDLRDREEKIRALKESLNLSDIDKEKNERDRTIHEERIVILELELENARTAFIQLDEQKQENLLLKETIDRMRYDMDELRNTMSSNNSAGGSSRTSSTANSLSKSLGAELAGKMEWDLDEEEQSEGDISGETLIIGDDDTTEGEEEDVIQTIITRKKRKVASRAQIEQYHHRQFTEAKEYSDTGTQYDPTEFAISRSAQTDSESKIITASFSTQTEPEPVCDFGVQTEVDQEAEQPVKVTMEMEIQTEEVAEEAELSRTPSPSPEHTESLASSSSTIIPPTPRQLPLKSLPAELGLAQDQSDPSTSSLDQPPAYHDHNWAVVSDVLKKWHAGARIPIPADGGVEGGVVSEELVEEWKTLKEELGVECLVIDKIIANSKIATNANGDNTRTGRGAANKGKGRSRFYNIYNTYIFGGDDASKSPQTAWTLAANLATQATLVAGASALVVLAVTPYIVPYYSIPGGATYYDRSAWTSFNTMQAAGEGFSSDGTDAVWSFLGRVGGGAARMARGWPT